MANRPAGKLRNLLPRRRVTYAMLKAACLRYRLPPGDSVDIEDVEKSDRYFLLHRASQVGPVFKAQGPDRLWVCIIGLDRCREFLQAHAEHLQGYMHDLEPMVPRGALRKMEGEDHRKYRSALVSGIHSKDLLRDEGPLNGIVMAELARLAASQKQSTDSALSFRNGLTAIATACLLKVFFGAIPGRPLFDALARGYYKLGPYGVVWNIGQQQRNAFAEIKEALQQALDNENQIPSDSFDNSIIGALRGNDLLDDTLLGNLIYMVEMGRYDMSGLLRWLAKYASAHPAFVERIACEADNGAGSGKSFAKAFVLETLRTDKSERLTRITLRDLKFERYLIPRGTYVRLCLWESHHMTELFEKPFDFDADRFVRSTYGANQFSPFGLDHHRCPLGDVAIGLGTVFLRNLARNYRLDGVGDGLPIRGAYHWEPAVDFGVRLSKRAL